MADRHPALQLHDASIDTCGSCRPRILATSLIGTNAAPNTSAASVVRRGELQQPARLDFRHFGRDEALAAVDET
jgi:hypothetical protein